MPANQAVKNYTLSDHQMPSESSQFARSLIQKKIMHTSIKALIKRMEQSEELLILGLGDSLTYGWEVDLGFFDRFVDRLSSRYPQARIQRYNAGIPGDTASGGLSRLEILSDNRPDLVIVQFGLNDAFIGVDPRDFERSIHTIAKRVLELPAAVILATSCALEREHDTAFAWPFYDAIVRAGADLAVPVAQLDRFWSNSEQARSGAILHNYDGVHPNDRGYEIMAKGLMELFENDA
jgi:acyl-CoA thioesterase-1